MKIVVILVFILLCAHCYEAALCLCGFHKGDKKGATAISIMHNSMFCCIQLNDNQDPRDLSQLYKNYTILGIETFPICYVKNEENFMNCCKNTLGLTAICR